MLSSNQKKIFFIVCYIKTDYGQFNTVKYINYGLSMTRINEKYSQRLRQFSPINRMVTNKWYLNRLFTVFFAAFLKLFVPNLVGFCSNFCQFGSNIVSPNIVSPNIYYSHWANKCLPVGFACKCLIRCNSFEHHVIS